MLQETRATLQDCTNSVPIVKNSQTAKMTIGVPIVTCLYAESAEYTKSASASAEYTKTYFLPKNCVTGQHGGCVPSSGYKLNRSLAHVDNSS